MPQRRYYCDYCGRSFIDTKEKRDAHFQSQVHQNNVRMWYESRKETALAVQKDASQPICITFKKTGFCRLGNKCPYRHVAITDDIRDGYSVIPDGMLETTVRPIEDTPWIPVKPYTSQETNQLTSSNQEQFIPLRVDLPPSLLPVHSSIFYSVPPAEWGYLVC